MSLIKHDNSSRRPWKRKQYGELVQALLADDSAGVLLSGEYGAGKTELANAVLESRQLRNPIIKLICSPTLTSSTYAALAPLIVDLATDDLNDVMVIRETLGTIQRVLEDDGEAKQVLIVIEEGHYIDSASAFVLGQLVKSGQVRLLVLSTEAHKDPFSLETLMSVAQLQRVTLNPLDIGEIREYTSHLLNHQVSQGTARIMRMATAGLQPLAREFAQLASRLGAFQLVGDRLVLNMYSLPFDDNAVDTVRLLSRRQPERVQELLALLSLAGPLTTEDLHEMGVASILHQQSTVLLRMKDNRIQLSSDFFAVGVRQGTLPGKKLSLFSKFGSIIGPNDTMQPEYAIWALSSGEKLDEEQLLSALTLANARDQYDIATEILDATGPQPADGGLAREELRTLLATDRMHAAAIRMDAIVSHKDNDARTKESARCAVAWFHGVVTADRDTTAEPPGAGGAAYGARWVYADRDSTDDAVAAVHDDSWATDQITLAREEYLRGDVALSLARAESVGARFGNETIASDIRYRLSLLVVLVRASVASGQYVRARENLDRFKLGTEYELHSAHGSLAVLEGMLGIIQGHMSVARDHLKDAFSELAVQDPDGLRPLCAALLLRIGEANENENSNGFLNFAAGALGALQTCSGILSPAAATWWESDLLHARLAFELVQSVQDGASIMQLLQQARTVNLATAIPMFYEAWSSIHDPKLREYAANQLEYLAVPEECLGLKHQQKSLLTVATGDPVQMEAYAHELHAAGETVLALEMMSRSTQYWKATSEARKRGNGIRKIHEWLYTLGEPPWGGISQTLTINRLTSRESEIIDLVRRGLSNREIARELTVSQRTVEGHLYRIFAKLSITRRSELNFDSER